MAKRKEEQPSPDEQAKSTTTTTTITPQKIDLQNYLDSLSLTRAERMYYERTYGQIQILQTYKEWESKIKIVH